MAITCPESTINLPSAREARGGRLKAEIMAQQAPRSVQECLRGSPWAQVVGVAEEMRRGVLECSAGLTS
jgi:hypothetical protein